MFVLILIGFSHVCSGPGEDAEQGGYTLCDTLQFEEGESSKSSNVEHTNNMPSRFGNMLGLRNRVRDRRTHEQLKNDLTENIWNKFGNDEDV